MKNFIQIISTISVVCFCCSASATESRQNNQHFYAGVRSGYTTSFCSSDLFDCSDDGSIGFGAIVGYQYKPWLSIELSSTDYGVIDISDGDKTTSSEVSGHELSWLLSYDDSAKLDAYLKFGATYQHSNSAGSYGLVSALGFDYTLNRDWSIKTEYQVIDGLGEGDPIEQADRHFVSLAIIYHLSQSGLSTSQKIQEISVKNESQNQISKNESYQVTADSRNEIVNFDFNSSYIRNEDKTRLTKLVYELSEIKACLKISGFTDKSGSTKYNKWLAYRRAQRVFDFFVSNGFDKKCISIDKYDELNSSSNVEADRKAVISIQ